MHALNLYAGPKALRRLQQEGLQPHMVRTVAAAAGGPKGLMLGRLDRFIFGHWLANSAQPVDLIGASIGSWRMAAACMGDVEAAFERLEHDYIHQHYELEPGQKRVPASVVTRDFAQELHGFFSAGQVEQLLQHPRWRLHVVTSRGRHVLGREQRWRTPAGYLGAFVSNAVHRRALGVWLERVVFSAGQSPLPFVASDYPTRHLALQPHNFHAAVLASCSIPFYLQAVHHIPGAPTGAYWDGGITDYHLHLNYAAQSDGLVLYPHFQRHVVPGWLDKALRWRHKATHFLDTTLLLAPNPAWVAQLPGGKLPDRTDFMRFGNDWQGRAKLWQEAVAASQQLADEFAQWVHQPDMGRVQAL
ncbi:patatin-like phospholipase family protein [Curvibacter sp. CHRR-16]|uniref:phospholipase n=1 Tax=Curvibacter sp. CHRR-16 TaxID=2835872 RepID=UPI001BDB5893|nr:phospholipase [Curvibacter sp. CHRR-16]MBT0571298.1 patatin-like phospholipase family protein [Curvibacter sp. CHRR-16]